MTIKEAIKLGFGFYIGYTTAKALDVVLGDLLKESGLENKIRAKLDMPITETKNTEAKNKVEIGFHI